MQYRTYHRKQGFSLMNVALFIIASVALFTCFLIGVFFAGGAVAVRAILAAIGG